MMVTSKMNTHYKRLLMSVLYKNQKSGGITDQKVEYLRSLLLQETYEDFKVRTNTSITEESLLAQLDGQTKNLSLKLFIKRKLKRIEKENK